MIYKKYYGACNSKDGFRCFFNELFYGNDIKQRYLIKGGPGTGKSTFLKYVSNTADALGHDVEVYGCSADISSLDGVIIRDMGICLFDATPPHAYDMKYPGCTDHLLDFTRFWNDAVLERKTCEIKELFGAIEKEIGDAYKFLAAAGKVLEYLESDIESYTDKEKLKKSAENYAARYSCGTRREVTRRMVSSMSGVGIHTEPAFCKFMSELYYIDEPLYIAPEFLDILSKKAKGRMLLCYSPISPDKLEAVYFEDKKTLFTSNPSLLKIKHHTIHASRFTDGMLKECRIRHEFEKKLAESLIIESATSFEQAAFMHQDLEEIYKKAIYYQYMEDWMKDFTDRLLYRL